jgi:hypothetical protein
MILFLNPCEATRAQLPLTKLPRKTSRIAHMAVSRVRSDAILSVSIPDAANQIIPHSSNVINEVSATQQTMVRTLLAKSQRIMRY